MRRERTRVSLARSRGLSTGSRTLRVRTQSGLATAAAAKASFFRGLRTRRLSALLCLCCSSGLPSRTVDIDPGRCAQRIAYIYKAERPINGSKLRVIWGKVTRSHGNSGVVRSVFRRNLPPKSFGSTVRIMLYPSNV